jgi:hypothetical protein
MIKEEYSSDQTNDSKVSTLPTDAEKGIQSFELDASMNGYSNCDPKLQESQLSTTGGYSNTMFSSSTRPSTSLGREINRESNIKIEEEFSTEFDKEVKTLDDAVKKVDNIADIVSLKKGNGSLCYPIAYHGSMILVFEDCGEENELNIKNEKIENELLEAEDQLMLKCEEYLNPNDLEGLRDYIYWGYYTKYTSFLLAVKNLFLSRIKKTASNPNQRWYFGYLYSIYMTNLMQEKNYSKFYIEQGRDLELIVNHWKEWKVNCSSYPRIPRCFRQYLEIKTYEPAVN